MIGIEIPLVSIKNLRVTAIMENGKKTTLDVYKSGDNHKVDFSDLPDKVQSIEFGILDTEPYKEQVLALTKRANHFETAYIALFEAIAGKTADGLFIYDEMEKQ